MKQYFQEKENEKYSLRYPQKYLITRSRTSRFEKSAIIQMQYTANELNLKGKIT